MDRIVNRFRHYVHSAYHIILHTYTYGGARYTTARP